MKKNEKNKVQNKSDEKAVQPQTPSAAQEPFALEDILAEARSLTEEPPAVKVEVDVSKEDSREFSSPGHLSVPDEMRDERKSDKDSSGPPSDVQTMEETKPHYYADVRLASASAPSYPEEERTSFKNGFTGFLKGMFSKKRPQEDEPDEMMLKYGDIKIRTASEISAYSNQEEKPSFGYLFGEAEDTEDEETTDEYNAIFEKIHKERTHKIDFEQQPSPQEEVKSEKAAASETTSPAKKDVPAETENPGEEPILPAITLPAEEQPPEVEKPSVEGDSPLEEVPPEEETPAEEQTPAEVEMPAEAEVPEEVESPAEEKVPPEVESPTKEVPPPDEEIPAKTDAPAEAEPPSVEEVPPATETPAEEGTPAEVEAPAEVEVPAQVDVPPTQEIRMTGTMEDGLEDKDDADREEGEDFHPQSTIEFNIFTEPESRFEKNFGKCKPAAPAAKADGGFTEDTADSKPVPKADKQQALKLFVQTEDIPGMVIRAGKFSETLREEYAAYRDKDTAGKEEPEEAVRQTDAVNRKRRKFVIIGETEEENDPEEDLPPGQTEEIDDYSTPEDAPSVKAALVDDVRKMFLRTVASGAAAVAIFVLMLLNRLDLPAVSGFYGGGLTYLIANFVILSFTIFCCWTTVKNGFSSFAAFHGNADSALAFAASAGFLQCAVSLFVRDPFINGSLSCYAGLVVVGLFLNSIGKFVMVRRVFANFKFASSSEQKYAAKIFNDKETAVKLFKGLTMQEPVIAYQKKADFLTDFLKLSYEPDPSEKLAGKMAPFGVLCSLAVGILSYCIAKDLAGAITVLTICACVCVPMCGVMAVNVPLRSLCKAANKAGAMLIGYPAVRQFADVNAVLIDAQELYPKSSVVLHGIKTFGGQRIDDAILDAAAVMCQVGGPLSVPFDQIIQGKSNLLPAVDNLTYEDDMGIIAWVKGRRILVGNRRLLESHGIAPPSRDYEKKYVNDDRQITYLAVAGDLVAMFITSYTPDEDMVYEMQRLENNGVSFLIRTTDPNITAKLVADHFRIFFRSVKILANEHAQIYKELADAPAPRARAYLATNGKYTSLARMLTICINARSNISVSLILQIIGIILGFVLAVFLSFYAGVGHLGALEMLAYSMFWALAALIVPWVKRP